MPVVPAAHSYVVHTNPGWSTAGRGDTRVDGVAHIDTSDGWLTLSSPEGEVLLLAPASQVAYVKRV